MVLELEATVICVDDSEWMRNGDYPPTRLQAQEDAANLVVGTKMASNPENTVGVLAMAGDRVRVLLAPTSDPVKFLACMHGAVDPNADPELAEAFRLAAGEPSTSNTDTVLLESDSDTYVPFHEFIQNNPFVTGAESASDRPADDERATEEGFRMIREALARSANAAHAEISGNSSSGQELELDPQRTGEICFQFEVEDIINLQEEEEEGDEQDEADDDVSCPSTRTRKPGRPRSRAEDARAALIGDRSRGGGGAAPGRLRWLRCVEARGAMEAADARMAGGVGGATRGRAGLVEVAEARGAGRGGGVARGLALVHRLPGRPRSRAEDARAALIGDRSRGGGGAAPGRLRWLRCVEARGAMEAADARMAGGVGGATRGRAGLVEVAEARGAGRGGGVARGLALVHRLVTNGDPRSTPWSRRARSSALMSPSCSPSSLTASSTWSTAKQIDDLLAFYGWCDDVGVTR
uniref:VWFA domain-containing protein n=1 Tax=Oryza meridionalis TaxID=40149 RepID=A0A0E0EVR3_9ORYZ